MTQEERTRLREAVSEAKKTLYVADAKVLGGSCSACGCSYETHTFSCEKCRERMRSSHRREVKKLQDELEHARAIIRTQQEQLDWWRCKHRTLRLQIERDEPTPPPMVRRYETEEERREARRRTYRLSSRRRRERLAQEAA